MVTTSAGTSNPAGIPVYSGPGNRLNSGGGAQVALTTSQTGQNWQTSIPAGGTVPVPISGNNFYVTISTAPGANPLLFRVRDGVFNPFPQGTGLDLVPSKQTFDLLEIKNPTANPQTVQIWIGFGGYIDRRLILAGSTTQQIAFPTNPTAGGTASINFNDLSGAPFTDINGVGWLALNRVAIFATNFDAATDYIIQKQLSAINNGPGILGLLARTSLQLPVSGNYCIDNGGGVINVVASEIYNAIPAM